MGKKLGRPERSKNITERENSRVKREDKNVVRSSERVVTKVVQSRVEQAV